MASMHIRPIFFLVLSFMAIACSQPAESADCNGITMLTLRESQGGFAGMTGTVWTINSDCSFTVSGFVNDQTREPQKRGQLTKEQILSLSRLLSDKSVKQMPAQIGTPAPVNPRQITMRYNDKKSVLNLPLGLTDDALLHGSDPASPDRRMIEILQAVKELTSTN